MKALVTGCAGFIGSRLSARLLDEHWAVAGVDSLSDYYDPALKRRNLAGLEGRPGFLFHRLDLAEADVTPLVGGTEVVFHLAGQPGVRASWGKEFDVYASANIMATQRLLEAAKEAKGLRKFVFASSSSVYGEPSVERVPEDHHKRPLAPYGVTKLAAEHLCDLYAVNFGVPAVVLRYFTVYGPGQRPDMSIALLVSAALGGGTFTLNGDGTQQREFTYVDDIVAGTIAAAGSAAGGAFNLGGGTIVAMNRVIDLVQSAAGRPIKVVRGPWAKGDLKRNSADTSRASRELGWTPRVPLEEGIARQVAAARAAKP